MIFDVRYCTGAGLNASWKCSVISSNIPASWDVNGTAKDSAWPLLGALSVDIILLYKKCDVRGVELWRYVDDAVATSQLAEHNL